MPARAVPPGWVVAQLPNGARLTGDGAEGDAVFTGQCLNWEWTQWGFSDHADVRLEAVDVTLHRGDDKVAVLFAGLRGTGVAALAALADLVDAHREEYEQLIESEQVMQALRALR